MGDLGYKQRAISLFLYLACFLLCFSPLTYAQSDSEMLVYEVKPGDSLTEIAARFGNIFWWVDIYKANRNKILNPDIIYPGQKLKIPPVVTLKNTPTDLKQTKKMAATAKDSGMTFSKTSSKKETLEKFRAVFKDVVEAEKKNTQKKKKEQVKDQGYEGLGLGGLILDETRSKMGSNFYSVFYNQWAAPQNVQNFTITVSEQPMRSRGTMVQVEIDNQLVYKSRLEPRYYKTQQAAKQAVQICQRRLKRIATMDNELAGY